MTLLSMTGRNRTTLILTAIIVLVVITALLFGTRGTGDMKIWERWTSNATHLGVVEGFRENDNDYPPGSNVVLWAAGHAGLAAGLPIAASTKLSLLAFLAVTLILFFMWTQSAPLTLGLWAVMVLNAVGMGYLDIYAMPPLILCVWALQQSRPTAAVTWFTAACLVKWQPLIIGPFLMLHVGLTYWPPTSSSVRRFFTMLAPSAALLVAVIAVFHPYPVVRAFAKSLGHRVLSGDTLNLPWIATWLSQIVTGGLAGMTAPVNAIPNAALWLRLIFKIVFMWQFLVLLYRYMRGPIRIERTLAYAMVGFLAYVTLSSGVHENHWFLPGFLAVVLVQYNRAWLTPAVVIACVASLNLLIFYGVTGHGLPFGRVAGIDVTVPLAAAAVAMYIWVLGVLRREAQAGPGPAAGR